MVTKCFVPGCRHDFRNAPGPKRGAFSFPTDPVRKRQWIEAIRRADFAPSIFSMVCEIHFHPHEFKRGNEVIKNITQEDGTVVTKITRTRCILSPEAVPSLFLDEPGPAEDQVVSTPRAKAKGRGPNKVPRKAGVGELLPEAILQASYTPRQLLKQKNKTFRTVPVSTFSELVSVVENLGASPSIPEPWIVTINKGREGENTPTGGIVFYQFDPQSAMPIILRSVTVDSMLHFKAYYGSHRIHPEVFQSLQDRNTISNPSSVIATWNDLVKILNRADTYAGETYAFDYDPRKFCRIEPYARALKALEERKQDLLAHSTTEINGELVAPLVNKDPLEVSKLNFLMEQISLLDILPSHRSYSAPLFTWTEYIMKRSLDACRFLDQSGALTVPRIRLEALTEQQMKQMKHKRRTLTHPTVTEMLPEQDNQDEEMQEAEAEAEEEAVTDNVGFSAEVPEAE